MLQINQNLNEGLFGDERATKMAEIRAIIRMQITHKDGSLDRAAAGEIAEDHYMCAQTVINFAFGKTVRPSSFTIRRMTMAAGYRLVMIPEHFKLPRGGYEFE
jgi:hypothetical protein